ncbi:MAG: hypothetical protein ACYTFW_18925 [Planctomycetota bacterium]
MAIMDAKLEFSDAQVISCASGSEMISENVIQMNSVKNAWGTAITGDYGEGNNGLVVNVQVATVFEASARMIAKLYTHTASAVQSGTAIGDTGYFAAAAAVGTKKQIRVPAGTMQKYIGLGYSVSGSSMDTGAVDAWLGLDHQTPST